MNVSLILIFSLSLMVGWAYSDSSPVFLWGNPEYVEQKPALHNVGQNEFAKIIKPRLTDSMVIVFLEDELNSYDFRMKCENAEFCYSNMKKFPDYAYITRVNKPVEGLRQLTNVQEDTIVNEQGYLVPAIEYEIGKIVFIALKNGEGPRSMQLKKTDNTINKIYNILAKKGQVTALYTRSDVSKRRIRRETTQSKQVSAKFMQPELLLYYSKLLYKENDETKTPIELNVSDMKVAISNKTHMSVNLTTDKKQLTFEIILNQGYYTMKSLKLGDQLFLITSAIEAPTGFSYFCGIQTFNAANQNKDTPSTAKIMWNGLQLQARFEEKEQKKLVFGESWHCVGFFSPGILSGLFVSFMLLAILAVGICWLMDINTMDRFDDPKGKSITINTSD